MNTNVAGILQTSTSLSTVNVQNFFPDTNTPARQVLAELTVVSSLETLFQNGATGATVYIPIFDNVTGSVFVPTAIDYQQIYMASQSATAGSAGVFAGTAAATATLGIALANQVTPKNTTVYPPGTGPLFSSGILSTGPAALTTTTSIVSAAATTGTFAYGNQQYQFITPTLTSTLVNACLPGQTLYLAVIGGGTTSANLTVTQTFKAVVEGLFLPF